MKKRKSKKIFIFIFILLLLAFGIFKLYQRYGFSRERADLKTYLGVEGDSIAIYVNDVLEEQVEDEKIKSFVGICERDSCYLPLSWVKNKLNNRFYYAQDVKKILYTLPTETKGFDADSIQQVANAPYIILRDEPYLLVDFVKEYTNIRYDMYLDSEYKRVYIYTNWDKEIKSTMKRNEACRSRGGNKSEIITDCKKGEEIKILERMTKWSKIKTTNGYIGYVRNSKIGFQKIEIPKSNFIPQTREHFRLNQKVCLGFHQVFNLSSSNTTNFQDIIKNTKGMNVIAPTWYCIRDNSGEIRSIANAAYTQAAHKKGLKVWATVNNFDVEDVDEKKIFSKATTRKKMIDKLMKEVDINYLDGINLDIEGVSKDAGEDYTQFVRELSVACREKKIVLSIDTYVPYTYNSHYDLSEYNFFCDYVIIMCYDEHYRGSNSAGSVSSIGYVRDGINLSLPNVDKNKLIVALGFYTRLWTTEVGGKVSSIVYDSTKAYQAAIKQGLKFEYDIETAQNYGSKVTQTGDKVEIWLEDETSLTNKMIEIVNKNVAGTAAWKLGQQQDTFFEIINMN